MATSTKVRICIDPIETQSSLGAGDKQSRLSHMLDVDLDHANGTAANQNDRVWSTRATATAAADSYDLAGTLTSQLDGSVVTFAEVTYIAVYNESTTTTENLNIGGGSNAFASWLGATGDEVVVGPSGVMVVSSPIDGYSVTAGTGDLLQIDPGSDTITYQLVVVGRSA